MMHDETPGFLDIIEKNDKENEEVESCHGEGIEKVEHRR